LSRPLATLSAATGLVAVGGLAGAALATGPAPPARLPATPAMPVETRSVVVHRTVHVYRRPKHHRIVVRPTTVRPAPSAPAVAAAPAAPAAVRPLVTRTSHHATTAKPLVTRTSGASGGRHGDDGEGEGHDD
jgi:hypothetical protein